MAKVTEFSGEILDSEWFNHFIDLSIESNRKMLLDRFEKKKGDREDAFSIMGALPAVSISGPGKEKTGNE